jgi:hypothetical protein
MLIRGIKVITYVITKIVYLSTLNNRESITSIKCISIRGNVIPLRIIIVGQVMLEKHFNNSLNSNTLLIVLESKYLNDALRLK